MPGRRRSTRSLRDTVSRRELVLKFDQNTPPLPGVPQVPLAESMARLNAYPDGTYRELREAAASYVGLEPENVVVGAGADDLILLVAQTFLGPGARAAIDPPTYALYRIATTLHGGDVVGADDDADLRWVCNPNNPTGSWVEPEALVELAEREPGHDRRGRRGLRRVRRRGPALRGSPSSENLVVIRTLSKAFGFAALRVGYALAHPETARLLTERRAPGPDRGSVRVDRSRSAPQPAPRRRRRDDRGAGADADVAGRGRLHVRADGDELRLRADRRAARRAARGAGHRRARVSRCDPGHRSPPVGERRAPARARGRARPRSRPRGDRHPHDDRDRDPSHAVARRERPHTGRDGNRVPRPPADALGIPRRLRSRAPRRRRSRRRRAPHGRGRPRRARLGPRAGARRP